MAHRDLPETLLINADGAAEYITTSVFQYLKVACYGTDGISKQVCGNTIGREGVCSRPNCSFATEPVPSNAPAGTSIRIRVDTAYDVSPTAALRGDEASVPSSPSRMYSNMFLLGDPYLTLVERYNRTSDPATRIKFPTTIQEIWENGFTRPAGDSYENTIHVLLPKDRPLHVIVSQFTPEPYSNRPKIHFLSIKAVTLEPLVPAIPLPLAVAAAAAAAAAAADAAVAAIAPPASAPVVDPLAAAVAESCSVAGASAPAASAPLPVVVTAVSTSTCASPTPPPAFGAGAPVEVKVEAVSADAAAVAVPPAGKGGAKRKAAKQLESSECS